MQNMIDDLSDVPEIFGGIVAKQTKLVCRWKTRTEQKTKRASSL